MKLVIVAMRDSAVNAYGTPNCVPHVGAAVRGFGDEVNRRDPEGRNQLNAHPDDFELYELGSYDDQTARFELLEEPRLVARGKDLVRG